jgi:hypothetical protein
MKILSYSGEEVVTTDRMCEAVVDYARALAAENAADVVEIPVLVDAGAGTARLLIGPSSQLIVIATDDSDVALKDAAVVVDLRARISALGPSRAVVTAEDAWVGTGIDLDFL